MIGVELIQGRTARTPAKEMTDRLLTQAWRNGVLLLSCGASTLRLMPPLTVTKPIADEAMTIIEQSLKAVL
jgi:4-aminobutyrate aminotransferase